MKTVSDEQGALYRAQLLRWVEDGILDLDSTPIPVYMDAAGFHARRCATRTPGTPEHTVSLSGILPDPVPLHLACMMELPIGPASAQVKLRTLHARVSALLSVPAVLERDLELHEDYEKVRSEAKAILAPNPADHLVADLLDSARDRFQAWLTGVGEETVSDLKARSALYSLAQTALPALTPLGDEFGEIDQARNAALEVARNQLMEDSRTALVHVRFTSDRSGTRARLLTQRTYRYWVSDITLGGGNVYQGPAIILAALRAGLAQWAQVDGLILDEPLDARTIEALKALYDPAGSGPYSKLAPTLAAVRALD